jgi:hypothetical protein
MMSQIKNVILGKHGSSDGLPGWHVSTPAAATATTTAAATTMVQPTAATTTTAVAAAAVFQPAATAADETWFRAGQHEFFEAGAVQYAADAPPAAEPVHVAAKPQLPGHAAPAAG